MRRRRATTIPPCSLPAPFRWPATTSRSTCPAARRCSRPAAAASPRARTPRSTSAADRRRRDATSTQPRAARRRGRRARASASSGPPGARGDACGARPSRPGRQRPRGRGGRPGDRADDVAGARAHRRLPAGGARRRRRRRGAPRRLARAGRRHRRRGRRALRELGADGPIAAAIGPAARGCCYEVGEEVHAAFAGTTRGRRAQPRPQGDRARSSSRRPASTRSTTSGCARCAPTPSCSSPTAATAASPAARRGSRGGADHGARRRAVRARDPSACASEIAAAAQRAGRDPAEVELLAAVKYVAARGARRARRGRARRWWARTAPRSSRPRRRRIPALHAGTSSATSRAARSSRSCRTCELIHSVASDSVLRSSRRHGTPETEVLVEVNVAGEEGKSGIAPGRARRLHRALPRAASSGLMTMPPFAEDPEDSRPHFAALRELAAAHGLPALSMGTSQDYAVAVEEGATIVRVGTRLYGA